MMHFHPTRLDSDVFFRDGPIHFAELTETNLRGGRSSYTALRGLGLSAVRVDYVTVDTVRVPRETFARIWRAWRDGYTDALAERTRFSKDEVLAYWNDMIACIEDPDGYGVWQVPIISGRVPAK